MDIFKLEDIILPKEITQKDREQKRPGAKVPFDEMLRNPEERKTPLSTTEVTGGISGEDKLTLSQEGKAAYQIARLILSVMKTPDIRKEKVEAAAEFIKNKHFLSQQVIETTAERLLAKLTLIR